MPLLVQHSLMSGRAGAVSDSVLFVSSVDVSERNLIDGKLLPWRLYDVTVTSYMTNGLRFSMMVEFSVNFTFGKHQHYNQLSCISNELNTHFYLPGLSKST